MVARPTMRTVLVGIAFALLGLSAIQLLGNVGPLHEVESLARTRSGLVFELPDNGVTLGEFRRAVAESTHGCGAVVVREGSIQEDATVISGGSGRGGLDAAGNRSIYVWTSGPGRQAPPPPTTEPAPQP